MWKWAAVVLCVALLGCEPAPDDGTSYGARDACEQFVTKRLKSPGSAEFSGQTENNAGRIWTATGSVDSQNSFGGLVRNDYTCVARYLGGDDESYRLVSVDGLVN